MSTHVVTASLTVNYEKQDTGRDDVSSDGFLSLEVDDRSKEEGGLNKGDTSFSVGDDAWLLLFKEASVNLISVFATNGTLNKGDTTEMKSFRGSNAEYLMVSNSKTASLSRPAGGGGASLTWFGNRVVTGKGVPKLEMMRNPNGRTSQVVIDLGTEVVGVIKAEYDSYAIPYKLNGVSRTFPTAFVFAIGNIG